MNDRPTAENAAPLAVAADVAAARERTVVGLVGAVQFVNILDFVMVMPMGPDFAAALGIPTSKLGFIGGSYTAAAALSGVVGGFFLDRFDRKKALAASMFGLVVGTAMGGFATGFLTLLAARVVAGVFGGPATSIAYSIVADVVPASRRGKAMGAVMGAFSAASVLGVPAGLELARVGGWRMPFLAVAGLGAVVNVAAISMLPSLTGHIAPESPKRGVGELFAPFRQPLLAMSIAMTAVAMMGSFVLIPNISAYCQKNLGYPRERIGLLYFVGGVISFVAMRVVGRLVDRHGSARVGTLGTAMLVGVVWAWFVDYSPAVPVLALFVGFMLSMSFRNVAYNTLTTKVPGPSERARFLSIQSAVQHLASAVGAFLSSTLLRELPGGRLEGIERTAYVSIGLSAVLPALLVVVERRVRARDAEPGTAPAT